MKTWATWREADRYDVAELYFDGREVFVYASAEALYMLSEYLPEARELILIGRPFAADMDNFCSKLKEFGYAELKNRTEDMSGNEPKCG